MRAVMRDGTVLVLAGLAVGIPAGIATLRLVSSHLFGVAAADPLTIVSVAVVLIAIAELAIFAPRAAPPRLPRRRRCALSRCGFRLPALRQGFVTDRRELLAGALVTRKAVAVAQMLMDGLTLALPPEGGSRAYSSRAVLTPRKPTFEVPLSTAPLPRLPTR